MGIITHKSIVLKLIIASLIVFSVVILFLFAFFPSDISVSRVVQIRASPQEVQKKISDLKDWRSWNDMMITRPESNNDLSIEDIKSDGRYCDHAMEEWRKDLLREPILWQK